MQFKTLFESTVSESDLPKLAKKITQEIRKSETFVLWLEGKMGSGKTTLTRYLLRDFGLDPRLPVTSPTYGFLNDYDFDFGRIAHMDMHRGDSHINEIGLDYFDDYRGFIVEWPIEGEASDLLPPTHLLEIKEATDKVTQRSYLLKKAV